MWTARATGPTKTSSHCEIVFSDGIRNCRATTQNANAFGPVEIYVRQLGTRDVPADGWRGEIPAKLRELTGRMIRGARLGGDLVRLYKTTDPKGREVLLEFVDGAPLDLIAALGNLFKETDHGHQEGQLLQTSGAEPLRDPADGSGRRLEVDEEHGRGGPLGSAGVVRVEWLEKLQEEVVLGS